ncbi:hypothetical protein H2200_001538 [Cladophialophora chaetospira]|uniref:Transcription factor domain-containing protein n=1 Tax=Cladophialophora chaetospira TaxID=386627 RepID=A0AA38XM25_9EURO|nr:hypothetical protein H2200_001538 [Cladophialophora chaetospira]
MEGLLRPPISAPAQTLSIADGSSPASRGSRTSLGSRTRKDALEAVEAYTSTHAVDSRRSSSGLFETANTCSDAESYEAPDDATTRGLVSPADAEELFNRFVSHYMPEFPLVVFPAGTTSEDIRASKPTLFLAVIAAASGSSNQSLFRALNVDLLKEFAQKIMISSLKDLELVQAMLVMAAWYFPPDRFEDLKHYQYIHMAATMAMDIGLGEVLSANAPSTDKTQALSHGSPASVVEADAVEVGRYRTILSCYLLCAGVSMSMDRENMLKFTPFMNRSLSYLRDSPYAATTDKKLTAWVDLQHLSEEVADAFRRDRTDAVSLENPQVRIEVEQMSQNFERWWESVDKNILDDSILIAYHYNKARIYEVILYGDCKLEDLRPPFLIRSRRNITAHQRALTPAYTRTMFNLIQETQRCIGTFLGMGIEAVRSAPVMHYIRCFYCLTVLLNLRVLCDSPNNDLNKILEAETLQIEDILLKWQNVCARAAGPQNCRSPAKFGHILANIQHWLEGETSGEGGEDLRPLTLLNAKQPGVSSQPEQRLPGTFTSPTQDQRSLGKSNNLAPIPDTEVVVDWTYPASVQVTDDISAMGWNQPYHLLAAANTTDTSEWSDQSAFGSFVPMELDQSAIAFFEAMGNDVAHSFVPTSFHYNENDPFDSIMYQ